MGPPLEPFADAEELICGYPWPCAEALYVWGCESGRGADLYNETAIWNAGVENHAVGHMGMAWPLHAWRWNGATWGDLALDVAAAYSLYAEDLAQHGYGWRAWGCQP